MVVQITLTTQSPVPSSMVDLPSTLEATVPNQLNDETGVASAVAFLAFTIPITVVLNLAASLAAVSAVGSDAGATLIFIAGSICCVE